MTLKTKNIAIENWWDLWIAIFAMGAVVMVSGRLWATEWTESLYILVYLTFLAGLSGLALGYSKFSTLTAVLFSTVYGIFSIGWLFGTTINLDITWRERILNHLGWRLRLAVEQFSAGQAVTDPILFLILMAVLLWIMASTATFILIRQGSVWPVLIPLGITLLVISHYDQDLPRNTRYLMTFLFFTLLIIGRMNFLRNREKWRLEGINTSPESHAALTRTLLILALLLVVVAWIFPITPQQVNRYTQWWHRVSDPWDRLMERFADIFVLEQSSETIVSTFFGETLGLGSGSPADEEIVFTVQVDSAPPAAYRNYWRTRSYDLYEDGEWSTTPVLRERLLFPDNFEINYPQWEVDQTATYTLTTQVGRMSNLYVTGMPTWISRPVEIITQTIAEDEEDLIALIADPVLFAEETYRFTTRVSVPSAIDLSQTDTDYPAWLDRYLQLPDDFSPTIAALATNIGSEIDHPYDIAAAITRYLRINIEYARTIPPVPANADPIEWFLFDEQTGFCNYYATAQVLMLRSLGIPARFVVGYAEGEYDPQTQSYSVRKQDSHAWPEVYFLGYGWIPFEPTTNQRAFILPAGSDRLRDNNLPESGESPILDDIIDDPFADLDDMPIEDAKDLEALNIQSPRRFEGTLVMWISLIIFLLVLVIGVFILQRPDLFKIDIDPLPVLVEGFLEKRGLSVPNFLRRWSYLAQISPAERAYRQMCRSIQIMGQTLNPAQTPTEHAQTLVGLIPQAQQPALEIVSEYHLDKFSDHYSNDEVARSAGRQVISLALEARLKNLFRISR